MSGLNTRSNLAGSSYMGSQASESQASEQSLPHYSPTDESYMLNGIVSQVPIDRSDYDQLLQSYARGHLFTATRLPARKRTFQFRSQLSFNLYIPSKILITPFTVAILQRA